MPNEQPYEQRFDELLASVGRASVDPSERLCALWPIEGSRFEAGGLLVVGRAVNGWGDEGDAWLAPAAALLRLEVEHLRPGLVLVFAGAWFDDFFEPLRLTTTKHRGLVLATARERARVWVVAEHPMTRPEDEMVREVVRAFERAKGEEA